MNIQTVTVERVDIDMLWLQLNTLISVADHNRVNRPKLAENLDGLIHLIEAMLDSAELLPEPLPMLLHQAGKTLGTHDPDRVMPYMEEQLTGEQYQVVHGFLTWLTENDYTFGHNIQEVYKCYRTGDTKGLTTRTELRVKHNLPG